MLDELDKRIIEELCKSSQGSYRPSPRGWAFIPTTLIQRVRNLEELRHRERGYRANVDYMKLATSSWPSSTSMSKGT